MIEEILKKLNPMYQSSYGTISEYFDYVKGKNISIPDRTNLQMVAIIKSEKKVRQYAVDYLKELAGLELETLGIVGEILNTRFRRLHPAAESLHSEVPLLRTWIRRERQVDLPNLPEGVLNDHQSLYELSPISLAHHPYLERLKR